MEVPNGWITPWGLFSLDARMPAQTAKRVAWGYEPVYGPEALALGLADYLVADDLLHAKTEELAGQLASIPAVSVQATKRWYQNACLGDAAVQDAHLNSLFREHCMSEESQATLRRFTK